MKKTITVEYEISDDNLKLLEEVHSLFKKHTGIDNSLEFTFRFVMKLNAGNDIKEKLEFLKENYSNL